MTNNHCCSQVIINGSLTIPDNKPDIETILRTTCTPSIKKTIVDRQYTIICGELTMGIEYAAYNLEGTQPVYFTSFKSYFAVFLKPGHTKNQQKDYSIKIEYEQFEKAGPRLVNKFIILSAAKNNNGYINCRMGNLPCS